MLRFRIETLHIVTVRTRKVLRVILIIDGNQNRRKAMVTVTVTEITIITTTIIPIVASIIVISQITVNDIIMTYPR